MNHRFTVFTSSRRSPASVRPIRRRALLLVALVASGLAACGPGADPKATSDSGGSGDSAPLRVVATTAMIGDIVRSVGGDAVELTVLMGEAVDPHTYRVTRGDVVAIEAADVVYSNGLHLEGRMGDVLERRPGRHVAVAEKVPAERLLAAEEEPSDGDAAPEYDASSDPHVWMDADLWSTVADMVADDLADRRPADAAAIAARKTEYRRTLAALHGWSQSTLATIGPERRVLVTAHDAFGYFGRAYDVEVRGIQGLSTADEAGVRDINELVSFLVAKQIPAVFVESSVAEANVRAIIEGAAARGHEVTVGGTLFSDAMGAAGTRAGTYIGMMEHNVLTITRALGGVAPADGFVAPAPRLDAAGANGDG